MPEVARSTGQPVAWAPQVESKVEQIMQKDESPLGSITFMKQSVESEAFVEKVSVVEGSTARVSPSLADL